MKAAEEKEVAESVRQACLTAALRAHEDAGIRGLCAEGRWEAAVSAMRSLDLRRAIEEGARKEPSETGTGRPA